MGLIAAIVALLMAVAFAAAWVMLFAAKDDRAAEELGILGVALALVSAFLVHL